MRDDVELLHDDPHLRELLTHYAHIGADDRQRWLGRRMAVANLQPRDVARLHGELLAHDWLELSAGETPTARADGFSACYRVTQAGRRALRQAGPTAVEAAAADVAACDPLL